MRTALGTSLVFALSLGSVLACAAAPAPLPQDNSQNAPQYPSQDNSQQPQQDDSQQQDNGQPQVNSQVDTSDYQNFSPDQLDNLVSPIALYPDPLLAQVFVAATFPDQVEEAARYVRASGTNGVDDQDWDVSVRAVAHYPTVIEMMADKIDWTTSLGQAYVNQSTDVSTSVQRLRHQAKNVGNLETSPQQEVLENDNYIAINPVQPQYIYVPVYDPAIIYYRRPYWGPGITFGIGYPIGGWLNLGFRWGYWGGGFGGVYYTGWNPGGWGRGCWNCGWIGRSRGYVNFRNNVYINNRYTNININRTVINRRVNVTNINRYNYVHRNVNYNNVVRNNSRPNRGQFTPGGNRPGNGNNRPGNNVRPGGNTPGNRPGNIPGRTQNIPGRTQNIPGRTQNLPGRTQNLPGRTDRPAANNKMLDGNINNNGRVNDFRGRDNNQQANRPQQQTRPTQQARPAPQARPQQNQPHAFGRSEGNFNVNQSRDRGQASRQQSRPAPQQRQQRSAPQRSAPERSNGGGRRH